MALLALTLLATFAIATPAPAAPPDFLWQVPEAVAPGPGASQLDNPRGMAADPSSGVIFVADRFNNRIAAFTPWGVFERAWGWDVAPEGVPGDTPTNELEACTVVCQRGVSGSQAGKLDTPFGMAVDGVGDVYVYEHGNRRVQKFDPEGNFLLMFGGEVNKTTGANVCTKIDLEGGEECGIGIAGAGPGQFAPTIFMAGGNYLTYSPVSGTIFVGDVDRIQEFGADGVFIGNIPIPVSNEDPTNRDTGGLAADPLSGDLYFIFAQGVSAHEETPGVFRIDATTGNELDVLEVKRPTALAIGPDGSVYVAWDPPEGLKPPEVVGFDATGSPTPGLLAEERFAADGPLITGLATNLCPGSDTPGNIYVSYVQSGSASYLNAFGTGPIGCELPPVKAPEITAQYAVSVETDGAILRAKINPRFWPDVTYYLQYGTEPCSEGACISQPAPPGTSLTKKAVNAPLATVSTFLAGLEPDTTYHYRFVAQSGGSEGEEVIGVGGKPGVIGAEATFTTFPLPSAADTDCPNQAFRAGPGAELPDCRAYEMVSPLEKNSGDIAGAESGLFSGNIPATYNQAALTGQRLTYSSVSPFGEAEGAPFISQFLSERQPLGSPDEGWSTEPIAPPRTSLAPGLTSAQLDNEFKAFSPDLCRAWLRTVFDPLLGPGAVTGFPNIYRRDNCGPGGYLGLTPEQPDVGPSSELRNQYARELQLQGVSTDSSVAFYIAADDFAESGAPANGTFRAQLYEYADGQLRFACILPNENPTTKACSAGTRGGFGGRGSSLQNAVSADGARVFWTDIDGNGDAGPIYMRIGGEETIKVSQTISNGNARFHGAATDGSRAIFGIEGFLYSFDAEAALEGEEKPSTLIAKGAVGVLGVSQDANHVYFASSTVILGAGENSEGDLAVPGEPNLYHWQEGGEIEFIGTLSELDVNKRLSAVNDNPVFRTSRVASDGRHAAFMSRAPLTGYDNADALSGEPDTEVFRYAAESGELACVSCNPSGARPIGRERDFTGGMDSIWIAAQIPAFESPFHAPRVLSDDGSRLFFESYEALVPADTNGVKDVYQWEAEDEGSCDEGDANFNEGSGGCVELISTGESPHESTFVDASPSGNDVFFTTLSSLYGPDYGLVDIYDARVGGGFPATSSTPSCEGEACQGPLSAPNDPTPASSAFEGAGNVTESSRPVKCAKGRRAVRKAGRTRCVKKPRKAKRAKRANKNRRAAR